MFIREEEKEEDIQFYGKRQIKMKEIENRLKELNTSELTDIYEFYIICLLILKGQYTKAKETLESSSSDLEELLFLKTFVYDKLQILTSHKICFDMLSSEYQIKYKLLVSKEKIEKECKRIQELYEIQEGDLLTYKKVVWKEVLLKAGDGLKSSLCAVSNKESFVELVKGKKSLEECLLELGHMIRVWLLVPDNAIVLYEQAAAVTSGSSVPYFFLGITYRGKGEHEKAVEMYKKALAIKPEYPDCLFNLGNIYFECCRNLREAEKCYKSALTFLRKEDELEYNGKKSIISKGRILNLLGEIEKKKNSKASISYYIDGIKEDHTFIDNYIDLVETIRKLRINELATIIEHIAKVICNEEDKLNIKEIETLKQCVATLNSNLTLKGYREEVKGEIKRIYDIVSYLLSNAILNEYQISILKQAILEI